MQKQRFPGLGTYPANRTRAVGIITGLSRVGATRAENVGGHISQV